MCYTLQVCNREMYIAEWCRESRVVWVVRWQWDGVEWYDCCRVSNDLDGDASRSWQVWSWWRRFHRLQRVYHSAETRAWRGSVNCLITSLTSERGERALILCLYKDTFVRHTALWVTNEFDVCVTWHSLNTAWKLCNVYYFDLILLTFVNGIGRFYMMTEYEN